MRLKALPKETDALISRAELAQILPVSYKTLARWAASAQGPPYIKIGPRHVAYRVGDVRAWLELRKKGGQT